MAQSGVGAEPSGAEGDPASIGLGGRCRDTWVGSEGSVTLLFPLCVLKALKREVPTLNCVGPVYEVKVPTSYGYSTI